jgi:RNA polymerase sigma-70 factor (ECF subfamily)
MFLFADLLRMLTHRVGLSVTTRASVRTNEEWLFALRSDGEDRDTALADVRAYLVRSAFFYFRRHAGELRNWGPEELQALAEDAAQDALVTLLAKLDTFRGEARFLTWAAKFGVNYALLVMRRRQWRDVSLDAIPDNWEAPPAEAVSKDGWAQPELAAQREEIYRALQETVERDLTAKQRQVFNYVLLHGVNVEVVAEHFGMTSGALHKLTHDARRKLRKGLGERGFTVSEILQAFAPAG